MDDNHNSPMPRSMQIGTAKRGTGLLKQLFGQSSTSTKPTCISAAAVSAMPSDTTETPKCLITKLTLAPYPSEGPPLHSCFRLDNVSLETLMERLNAYIKMESILVVSCSNDDSSNRVECRLPQLRSCKFAITFWHGSGQSEHKGPIIVQALRTQGCAIQMQRIRRSLYSYLSTGSSSCCSSGSSHPEVLQSRTTLPTTIGKLVQRFMPSVPAKPQQLEQPSHDCMSACLRLLQSQRNDQIHLGLQNLGCATHAATCNVETALSLSRAVTSVDSALHQALLPHWLLQVPHQQTLLAYHELEFSEQAFRETTHSMGLLILTNALELLKTNHERIKSVQDKESSSSWTKIAQSLETNVACAHERPHDAALSCRCLTLLHDLLDGFAVGGPDLLSRLDVAHEIGCARHLHLEQTSTELFQRLRQQPSTAPTAII
jgi:hypothetical protein